jgi:hypothetical protein
MEPEIIADVYNEINKMQKETLFYDIMKYPLPKHWEYFSTSKNNKNPLIPSHFSRDQENPYMQEYRIHIWQHENLFKSIPWIKKIYLCNSITFNALHKWSDIDLFIITKKWSLRRARLASAVILFITGLKRSTSKIAKRYCLSFYVSEDAQNLYNISLTNTDIYLAYWLAHLVPLYEEHLWEKTIYEENSWISWILPNIQKQHLIDIGLKITKWNTPIKNTIEKYISWFFWYAIEYIIKTVWIPILYYKKRRLKEKGIYIIFNDKMLKFYNDKRSKIALLYRASKKNQI